MGYSEEQITKMMNQFFDYYSVEIIPVLMTFEEPVSSSYFKLNKKNELLVNIERDRSRNTIRVYFKPNSHYIYNISILPFDKIEWVIVQENFISLSEIGVLDGQKQLIISKLNEIVAVNERKTFVFSFKDFIYLPYYSLKPQKEFKIDVGKSMLARRGSCDYKPTLTFFLKTSSSKTYMPEDYFPFDRCLSFVEYEKVMFEKAKREINSNQEFEIKIRTTKTATQKEILITSRDTVTEELQHDLFPLIYIINPIKLIDRTHDNCLVCGTKLFVADQIYVHLLSDGNLTSVLHSEIKNHFNFFPVGKECLSKIPVKYQLLMSDIKRTNKR